jgi:hypothetical protein
MTIEGLIDLQVMENLSLYGNISRMDSYAVHLLKTSEHPLLRFRRGWMRRTALKQHLDAERRQKKINEQFKSEPYDKKASIRKAAVIDPHLASEMRHYNNASWNDKAFIGDVRREAPAIFPKRD